MPNVSEERLREIVREELEKRSAEAMAELDRRLPSMLDRVEKRRMG